ncbi:hypothetical protein [Lewinella sp. W8]|uniref:hypothetical protein n=1 Tax=Lewinella sp. W8 TaxID=2528208 RepID=UPI0010676D57|nr:hypothetical protein [Lewinella sp. W8]MTB49959.1 hypothetical protein [Lewinella sp. W8]
MNTREELDRYRKYLAEIGFLLDGTSGDAPPKAVLPKVFTPTERTIFGPHDFSQTVGFWLPAAEEDDALLLSPFISTEDFEFTPEEYLDLSERLEQTRRRYEKLGPVPAALESLNTGFFRHQSLAECKQTIEEQIHYFLGEAEDLQRQYSLLLNDYSRQSLFRAQRSLGQRLRELRALRDLVMDKLPAKGRKEKKLIGQLLPDLARYADAWETDSPTADQLSSAEAIRNWLAAEETAIEEKMTATNRQVRADGLGLSPLTVNPQLGKPEAFQEVEQRLRALLRTINEAGLYQLPVGRGEAATSHRQLLAVRELVQQLRNTEQQLGQLEAFYHRRHFWYAQPAKLRRLLAPLLDAPRADWRKAFDGWYFERCLDREAIGREGQREPVDLKIVAEQLEKHALQVRRTPAGTSGLRVVVREDSEWPSPLNDREVLIDLTREDRDGDAAFAFRYHWKHLDEPSAVPLRTAGWRRPGLLFHQEFAVLTAPEWRAVGVDQPPAGSDGRLAFAEKDTGDWQHFDHWKGRDIKDLCLYVPTSLSEEDETWIRRYWDSILLLGDRVTLFHDWDANALTQALISDGLNARFLAAALIRAAEAAGGEPFDQGTLLAIGREVRRRCGLPALEPHPMTEYLLPVLKQRLPNHFFSRHRPWRDTFLPLEVTSPNGKKAILLPDGWLPGRADPMAEAWRQRELRTLGFDLITIDALSLWRDKVAEIDRLVEHLRALDDGITETN